MKTKGPETRQPKSPTVIFVQINLILNHGYSTGVMYGRVVVVDSLQQSPRYSVPNLPTAGCFMLSVHNSCSSFPNFAW